jgi:hypothetical protein
MAATAVESVENLWSLRVHNICHADHPQSDSPDRTRIAPHLKTSERRSGTEPAENLWSLLAHNICHVDHPQSDNLDHSRTAPHLKTSERRWGTVQLTR